MWSYISQLLDPDWDDDAHPAMLPAQHWCSGGIDDLYRSPNPYNGGDGTGPMLTHCRLPPPHPVRRDRHYVPVWMQPEPPAEPELEELLPEELEPVLYEVRPSRYRDRDPPPRPEPPIDTSRPYVLHTLVGAVIIYPPGYHTG